MAPTRIVAEFDVMVVEGCFDDHSVELGNVMAPAQLGAWLPGGELTAAADCHNQGQSLVSALASTAVRLRAASGIGPSGQAEGAFRLAIVFQGARRFDLAMWTAESAAKALGRLVAAGEPEAVALRGALYLQLAVASARTNDGDQAYAYLGLARQAAAQLGVDRNDYNTEFGPTNVMLYEVNIAIELGDAGHALRVAAKADTARLSPERQARLLIDVARGHAQRRQLPLMVSTVRQAEQIAPEQVHTHPLVRELVEDALRSDQGDFSDLQELAKDLNLIT